MPTDYRHDPRFAPIMAKHRAAMNGAMQALQEAFPGVGLCLFLFDKTAEGPQANYISNTNRKQTLEAIKEWVKRQEQEP